MNTNNIDKTSLEFDGIDRSDHPDYCDAYISKACWNTGRELTETELDTLNDEHRSWVYDKLWDFLY